MDCGWAFLLGALIAIMVVMAAVIAVLLYIRRHKKTLAQHLVGDSKKVYDVAGRVLEDVDKEVSKYRICNKCGHIVPSDSKVCKDCGAPA